MRIHLLAMVALLTAAVVTGCDSAREVRGSSSQANAWGCDQCHGYPPPPFFPRGAGSSLPGDTFPHAAVTGAMCSVCHPATVLADGHTIVSGGEHRDSQVEAVYPAGNPLPTAATCESCHGVPPDTGRHLFHVVTRGQKCATCHDEKFDVDARTADDAVHMQGLDYITVEGGTHVTKQAGADGAWPAAECNACHAALGVSDD